MVQQNKQLARIIGVTSSGIGSSSINTGILQGSHCNALIINRAVVLVHYHRSLRDTAL